MIKNTLIKIIIKLSSSIQTALLNYLDYNSFEPKECEDRSYKIFSGEVKKPSGEREKPFQKEDVIRPHYTILLSLAQERNCPILPISRRSVPLRTGEKFCRKCKAPQEYLTNHGYYTRKSSGEKFAKHTCKVCLAEYAPGAERKKPKHICPFCGYAMNPEINRKNYRIYRCKQEDCKHRKLHPRGYRYVEHDWHFNYDELKTNNLVGYPDLSKLRIDKNFINKELSLYVGCGATASEVNKIIEVFYGEKYIKSNQTIINHLKASAGYIKSKENVLPVILGEEVVQDETYVKYKGKWGYLFRAINPENRAIIGEYFSPYRDAKSCIILNKIVTEKYHQQCRDPNYRLISDGAPIYKTMQNYFDKYGYGLIEHKAVCGIFDKPNEENSIYRPQ